MEDIPSLNQQESGNGDAAETGNTFTEDDQWTESSNASEEDNVSSEGIIADIFENDGTVELGVQT